MADDGHRYAPSTLVVVRPTDVRTGCPFGCDACEVLEEVACMTTDAAVAKMVRAYLDEGVRAPSKPA